MSKVLRLIARMTSEVLGARLCAQHQSQQRLLAIRVGCSLASRRKTLFPVGNEVAGFKFSRILNHEMEIPHIVSCFLNGRRRSPSFAQLVPAIQKRPGFQMVQVPPFQNHQQQSNRDKLSNR